MSRYANMNLGVLSERELRALANSGFTGDPEGLKRACLAELERRGVAPVRATSTDPRLAQMRATYDGGTSTPLVRAERNGREQVFEPCDADAARAHLRVLATRPAPTRFASPQGAALYQRMCGQTVHATRAVNDGVHQFLGITPAELAARKGR